MNVEQQKPQRGGIPADWISPRQESRPVGPFRFFSCMTQGSAGTAGCAPGYRISPRSGLFSPLPQNLHGYLASTNGIRPGLRELADRGQ